MVGWQDGRTAGQTTVAMAVAVAGWLKQEQEQSKSSSSESSSSRKIGQLEDNTTRRQDGMNGNTGRKATRATRQERKSKGAGVVFFLDREQDGRMIGWQ